MRYVFAAFAVFAFLVSVVAQPRPRARDLGIVVGIYPSGARNAITDVDGVRVGHTTIIEADRVRTGVTAIVPHGGNVFQDKVAGAVFVGNAFGKLAGSTQVNELGTIETPIVLTNTLSVGTAMDAVVRYTIAQPGNERVRSVNALVGETNDGGLNDIRGLHVTREHVASAIAGAAGGAVEEGAVVLIVRERVLRRVLEVDARDISLRRRERRIRTIDESRQRQWGQRVMRPQRDDRPRVADAEVHAEVHLARVDAIQLIAIVETDREARKE